jgi:hypothetical protein
MRARNAFGRVEQAGFIIFALVMLAGCAVSSPEELAEKNRLLTSYPPPGQARIWIFRTYQPEITRQEPFVRVNGRIVGVALLGRAYYRDVPPGPYEVTVDSEGVAPYQFAHFALAPGETAYVAIDANSWWAGVCWRCEIPTFYTLIVAQPLALAEIAPLPLAAGG